MNMRLPATPIITIDPYFSVWSESSVLKNPIHWTGSPNTMQGRVSVDGKEYHFLGYNETNAEETMRIESTDIDAYSTYIVCSSDEIRLHLTFTSPLLTDDLYYASRPIAYCKASYESKDGKDHKVKVRFTASEELVLNTKGEGRALASSVKAEGVTAVKMGNGEQKVLGRSGDGIRIDWGFLYLGVKGKGEIGHTVINGMYAIYCETELLDDALFLFGYDDVYSIKYFDDDLEAYWKKGGKTMESALSEAANDYDELFSRCCAFSDKLKKEAAAKGGEKYAELLLLALRQVMAAHKLVLDKNGDVLYISKECYSGGCAATVDVTYPSAPLFLLYNTELLKGMLRPVMRYAASKEWTFDFAPHDLGMYPILDGQMYWVERSKEKVYINKDGQMPVEECGNMIILFAAICEADGNTDFVRPYMDTVTKWNEYLIRYGLDPENQLCTDDFAGHMAHNVNLSVKAIMGIEGYSRILKRFGEDKKAEEMHLKAKEYAVSLMERARNADGSFRLAYDRPDTFSLKYNSVWDKLWKTELFTEDFYKGEIERYKKELLPYGAPLDSREKYGKSDWLLWVASLAETKEDFMKLTDSLWSAYDTMRTRVPMTDWYYCDTSHVVGFRNRTVQGGLFIKLMFES
ncbi:MAG: DUF4965 domain-containing protein [Ruminococcaceae bacterium]|nr:DUF4965 domain-containing protein [Oscillospiraceae bacterium]